MVATVIVGMLCVHLLIFGVMFLLISVRLQPHTQGMDAFAVGNFLLGAAYVLQLQSGPEVWSLMGVVNHTLTLCVPAIYCVGGMRFFGRPAPLWRPLVGLALAYTALQVLVQWALGPAARHAMLAGFSALIFLAMVVTLLQGMRTFAKDLRVEALLFALLIGGIGVLNAVKGWNLVTQGLQALDMGNRSQVVFYIYMTFLATVLAPSMIWLVLRRLTDDLRSMVVRDPLTQLLNRRGLSEGLDAYFQLRSCGPVHLFIVDIDHFKRINDTHGHKAGDTVLCHVADVLRETVRKGDLACRMGGEEFVIVCRETDAEGTQRLAERVRAAVAQHGVPSGSARAPIRFTVTIGVSEGFDSVQGFDRAMQQADAALYRGKAAGRNRVVAGSDADGAPAISAGQLSAG